MYEHSWIMSFLESFRLETMNIKTLPQVDGFKFLESFIFFLFINVKVFHIHCINSKSIEVISHLEKSINQEKSLGISIW
jgi:hypothetical protein